MLSEGQLVGKVAVVTGGSRGIGLAVAEELISFGCDVVVSGRSADALDEARVRLARRSSNDGAGRNTALQADVRDAGDAERIVASTVTQFGGLDILINNAGVGHFESVADQSVEDWKQVIDTNLSGVFYACRAAIPQMRERGGGWILNISSLAGSHPFANGAAYCASKAGLDAFTTSLMQELRFENIRVSSVAPGSVGTAFAGEGRHATAPWKLRASDIARVVVDLLGHDARSLPSRVEIRPSRPRKS